MLRNYDIDTINCIGTMGSVVILYIANTFRVLRGMLEKKTLVWDVHPRIKLSPPSALSVKTRRG